MKEKYFLLFCLSFFAFSAYTKPMDDRKYEKWIHNIYLKHYKDPVSNSDWNSKIQSLPKNYQLKFKDNFWDLSGSFFKDSLYWSKLWVVNPQVENPHLIYKGNFIKFDPQTLSSASSSKYSVDIQSQFPGLVIPENKFSKGALSESEIPSSLPNLSIFQKIDRGIDISKLQGIEIQKQAIIPSYLSDRHLASSGKVVGRDGYGQFIGMGAEQLIVKIESDVSIGSVFTVFENKGRIGNLFRLLTLNENEIIVRGKIKILSYLKGTDSLYLAAVVESLKELYPGNSLLEGEPRIYDFSQKGPIGSGSGLIIGASDKNQIILNIGSVIYLSKGQKDGIQKGDFFHILGKTKNRAFKSPYKYNQPLLGQLKVIHTAKNKATGIIVASRDQIHVGDMFTDQVDRLQELSKSQDHETVESPQEDFPSNFEKSIEESGYGGPEPDELGDYEEIEGDEDLGFFDKKEVHREQDKEENGDFDFKEGEAEANIEIEEWEEDEFEIDSDTENLKNDGPITNNAIGILETEEPITDSQIALPETTEPEINNQPETLQTEEPEIVE